MKPEAKQRKAKEKTITCPSGFSGRIRRLRVKELDALSSENLAERGQNIDEVLKGVWLETIDPGPYKPPYADFSTNVDWGKVFQDDRLWVIIQLRRMKVGDIVWLRKGCPTPLCPNVIKSPVDLSKLEHHGLSEKAAEQLSRTGVNEFPVTLPFAEVEVAFKCLTGADENLVANLLTNRKDDYATASMLVRLPRTGGENSPGERRKFVREMDADDYEFLREQWEETEPMIEKRFALKCGRCKEIHEVDVPFGADFFSRRSAQEPKT